ncbi:hypothetical protein EK21DRAFT_72887 [Setomelanomma holmii]|uniref:Uncharacterized protein n=1 Tax=Setomelanomma holmii TaxID=210430 RepID=A0A9P4H4V1_9PLEO|nr:hypothetical protein EK21DRAFT_72887 [Setomelanomma holmii]
MEANNDNATPTRLGARKRYAHLYMPLITAFLIVINGPIVSNFADPAHNSPQNTILFTAASAIPTYLVASRLYDADRPDPTPEEAVRFTRKHDAYRAVVLATYGRLFGTPFSLQFIIADFMFSFPMGTAIGERPAGSQQRRSEFLTALLWVTGSRLVTILAPPSMPTLSFCVGVVDRTVWRAAYLALVDDIIGVLTRPNVRTFRGKMTLVLIQSFTITSIVYFVLSSLQRLAASQASGMAGE